MKDGFRADVSEGYVDGFEDQMDVVIRSSHAYDVRFFDSIQDGKVFRVFSSQPFSHKLLTDL